MIGAITSRDIYNKIPFFAISGLFAIVTLISVKGGGQITPMHFGDAQSQFLLILLVYTDYIFSFIAPIELAPAYTYSPTDLYSMKLIFALVAIFGLIAILTVSLKKGWREIVFGVFWFTLGILPNAQFVPTLTVRADRYMYHALTGLALIIIGLALRMAPNSKKVLVSLGLFLAIPIMLGLNTINHLSHYSNSLKYVQRFIDTQGWAPSAEIIRSRVYTITRQYYKAEKSLKIVVESFDEPFRSRYRMELAHLYLRMGKVKEAIDQLGNVAPTSPLYEKAKNIKGKLLTKGL